MDWNNGESIVSADVKEKAFGRECSINLTAATETLIALPCDKIWKRYMLKEW